MDSRNPINTFERELRQAEARHRELKRILLAVSALCAIVVALALGFGITSMRRDAARAAASAVSEPVTRQATAEEPAPAITGATVATEPVDGPSTEPAPKIAPKPKPAEPKKAAKPEPQRVTIRIGDVGYEPSSVKLSANRPIELTVEQGEGCAEGFIISKLGVNADNSKSDAVVRLGKVSKGSYRFTCGMEMVEGLLVVD